MQIVQLQQLRRATIPAVIMVGSNKLVQLGDDEMRNVTHRRELERGRRSQRCAVSRRGGVGREPLRLSTRSTSRRAPSTLIEKWLSRTYGTSPDSKWFLYFKNKQVNAFNLENGKAVLLDASLVPGKIVRQRGRRSRV